MQMLMSSFKQPSQEAFAPPYAPTPSHNSVYNHGASAATMQEYFRHPGAPAMSSPDSYHAMPGQCHFP